MSTAPLQCDIARAIDLPMISPFFTGVPLGSHSGNTINAGPRPWLGGYTRIAPCSIGSDSCLGYGARIGAPSKTTISWPLKSSHDLAEFAHSSLFFEDCRNACELK